MANLEDLVALTQDQQDRLDYLRKEQGPLPGPSNLTPEKNARLEELRKEQGPIGPDLAPGLASSVVTSQEEPPDASLWDRFRIKGMGRDKDKALETLRASHPDKLVQYDPDNDNFTFSDHKTGKITVLDPQTGLGDWGDRGPQMLDKPDKYGSKMDLFPNIEKAVPVAKEMGKDILEAVPEVLGQVVTMLPFGGIEARLGLKAAKYIPEFENALTNMGSQGLKLLVPKLSSALGLGARSASGEALTQGAGALTGINEKPNIESIESAGKWGAVLGGLLGSGSSLKSVQQIAKDLGLTIEQVRAAQAGVLPAIVHEAYGAFMGINPETTKNAIAKYKQIVATEGEGRALKYAESLGPKMEAQLKQAENEVGSVLEAVIDATKTPVYVDKAKQPLRDYIDELKYEYKNYPVDILKEEIDRVEAIYQNTFGTKIPAKAAKPHSSMVDQFGNPAIPAEPPVPSRFVEGSNKVQAKTAFMLQKLIKDPANLLSQSAVKAGIADANKGVPEVSKRIQSLFKNAYGEINAALEDAVTRAAENAEKQGLPSLGKEFHPSKLKKDYADLKAMREISAKHFDDPARAYNTISNLGRGQKGILFQQLQKIDKRIGTNLVDDAEFLDAYTAYGKSQIGFLQRDPGGINIFKKTATPGAQLLALAGYKAGGPIGAAGGAAVGYGLTSKPARRFYLDVYKNLEKPAEILDRSKLPIWNLMMNKMNQKQ